MAELTYTKVGDYYIPDLILDEEPEQDVFYGKYGDLRRDYLREYKPKLWMVGSWKCRFVFRMNVKDYNMRVIQSIVGSFACADRFL